MAQAEVASHDVVRVVLQFLRENDLTQTAQVSRGDPGLVLYPSFGGRCQGSLRPSYRRRFPDGA